MKSAAYFQGTGRRKTAIACGAVAETMMIRASGSLDMIMRQAVAPFSCGIE